MQNILKQLENSNKTIYAELPDEASGKQFLAEAKKAEFRFGDGVKPTDRAYDRVMALKNDRPIRWMKITRASPSNTKYHFTLLDCKQFLRTSLDSTHRPGNLSIVIGEWIEHVSPKG